MASSTEPISLSTLPGGPKRVNPQLLPCNIKFDGAVPISDRYWKPHAPAKATAGGQARPGEKTAGAVPAAGTDDQAEKGTAEVAGPGRQEVYFRGRLFTGFPLAVPDGYSGHVLKNTAAAEEKKKEKEAEEDGQEDCADRARPATGLVTTATFDEITVWEHTHAPDPNEAAGAAARASTDDDPEARELDALARLDNPYVRAVEEGLRLAQAIHDY